MAESAQQALFYSRGSYFSLILPAEGLKMDKQSCLLQATLSQGRTHNTQKMVPFSACWVGADISHHCLEELLKLEGFPEALE